MLNFCGIDVFYRRNFESIIMSRPDDRRRWLDGSKKADRKRGRSSFLLTEQNASARFR